MSNKQEKYENKFFKKYNNKEYEILYYKDSDTKLKAKHLSCGNIFDILPSNFYKRGCPICGRKHGYEQRTTNIDTIKDKIKKCKDGQEYELLEYKNTQK